MLLDLVKDSLTPARSIFFYSLKLCLGNPMHIDDALCPLSSYFLPPALSTLPSFSPFVISDWQVVWSTQHILLSFWISTSELSIKAFLYFFGGMTYYWILITPFPHLRVFKCKSHGVNLSFGSFRPWFSHFGFYHRFQNSLSGNNKCPGLEKTFISSEQM